MISFAIDFVISLISALAVFSYANTNIVNAINNRTITSFAVKNGAFCFLIILVNRIFGGSINVPFLFIALLYIPLGAMDSNYKNFNEDITSEIKACAKKIRLATILAGAIGLLAYSPRFNWIQIDFSRAREAIREDLIKNRLADPLRVLRNCHDLKVIVAVNVVIG